MKFGVMFQLSVPRPWTRESERTVINNALEQVKLADELGYDYVWSTEHHFLEEYSHSSAPERMSSMAVRSAMRIGLEYSGTQTTMPWPRRMRLVTMAQAVRNISGAEEWEYSSRKWCSVDQT